MTELWRQGARRFDELDDIDQVRYLSLLTWGLVLHENIYHQWSKQFMDEETYRSWTRYFAGRQRLLTHWNHIQDYFEPSFAQHVTAILMRQTQEVE